MNKMKRMRELVTSQDMFGHPISFNFDKKGAVHNTLIGGTVSILINVAMLLYWFQRLQVLI